MSRKPGTARKIEVAVTICRNSGGTITMEFEDRASHVTFFALEMSPEEFGNAITALGARPAVGEVRGLHLIGMRSEHKEEPIRVPGRYDARVQEAEPHVAAFEVDGWIGSRYDVANGHRWKGDTVRVGFTRYVDPVTGKPALPTAAPQGGKGKADAP